MAILSCHVSIKLPPKSVTVRKFNNRRNDEDLRRLAGELSRLIDDEVGLLDVRADWFIDSTTRPPLYHAILDLPGTAQALEQRLAVDVESDFLNVNLKRAGFARSDISHQNRLVDRHESSGTDYYWKSYDFRSNEGTGNIFKFPLGPVFRPIHFRGWHSNMPAARSSSAFPTNCKRICWSRPTARDSTTARPTSWATTRRTPARLRSSMACRAWAATKTACTFKDDFRVGAELGGKRRNA